MINIELIEIDVADAGHITNTYIISDEKKNAVVIDPADNSRKIINILKENKLTVEYIIITHAHGDHIGALEEVQKYSGAQIIVHSDDKEALLGNVENYSDMLEVNKQNINEESLLLVKDGDVIKVGDICLEIIHTPGHTQGAICILEKNTNVLFTGDTIFWDCYGRCDLYSGNFDNMVNSLRKIFDRFQNIQIYPGHDKQVNIDSAQKRIRLLIALKGINL